MLSSTSSLMSPTKMFAQTLDGYVTRYNEKFESLSNLMTLNCITLQHNNIGNSVIIKYRYTT